MAHHISQHDEIANILPFQKKNSQKKWKKITFVEKIDEKKKVDETGYTKKLLFVSIGLLYNL